MQPGTFQGNRGGKWALSARAAEAWLLVSLEEGLWEGLVLIEYLLWPRQWGSPWMWVVRPGFAKGCVFLGLPVGLAG